jgi:hypothetical protein
LGTKENSTAVLDKREQMGLRKSEERKPTVRLRSKGRNVMAKRNHRKHFLVNFGKQITLTNRRERFTKR